MSLTGRKEHDVLGIVTRELWLRVLPLEMGLGPNNELFLEAFSLYCVIADRGLGRNVSFWTAAISLFHRVLLCQWDFLHCFLSRRISEIGSLYMTVPTPKSIKTPRQKWEGKGKVTKKCWLGPAVYRFCSQIVAETLYAGSHDLF